MSAPIAAAAPLSTSSLPTEASRRVWEITCNVVLSLLFLRFAVQQGQVVAETLRFSSCLLLAKVSTDTFFYLIRSLPKGLSFSLYDWLVGIAGTCSILFFQSQAGGEDRLIGQVLQLGGIGLQVLAMLSLNRSIGIVAANRGVKTRGLYAFIRHPLYCSYTVAFLGYIINHPTPWNFGVYIVAVALWVLRLLAEERFLLQDPEYRGYAERVRSRLIPGVF